MFADSDISFKETVILTTTTERTLMKDLIATRRQLIAEMNYVSGIRGNESIVEALTKTVRCQKLEIY